MKKQRPRSTQSTHPSPVAPTTLQLVVGGKRKTKKKDLQEDEETLTER